MGPRLLAYPYQVARTPLAVLDVTLARRLPADSTVRRTFDRAFGSLDLVAGRLFTDQTLLRQGAERIGRSQPAAATSPDASDGEPAAKSPDASDYGPAAKSPGASDYGPPAKSPAGSGGEPAREAGSAGEAVPAKRSSSARRARTAAAKSRQHDDARANQSLSTIKQRLVQTEAVTEARNRQADAAQ